MPDRRHVMRNERLARLHRSTDRRFLRLGFLGDRSSVSGMARSPLASDATVFCFFFPLTFAKLKQEVLNLRGSNSCRMTEVERTDEMQHGNPETCWIRISRLRTEIPVLVCS